MNRLSTDIKQSKNGDEYYSPPRVVEMIVPYLKNSNYKTIWCPFDKENSNFVKILRDEGFKVNYGHIETGQDFFNYSSPQGDIVVSNPPFSKRTEIFERLYQIGVPFALVMNFNGLFDSKKRYELFKNQEVEFLIPKGRMKFINNLLVKNSPNFQSIYICSKLLSKQIVFADFEF